MAEVYKNEPVEVSFTVYEVDYKKHSGPCSPILSHSCDLLTGFCSLQIWSLQTYTGSALGGHAVKLIGWGTSGEGEDYWVC